MAASWQSVRNCHNLPIQEVLDKCLEYGTEAILFTGSHDECSKFRRLCPSSFTVDATQFFSRDPMLDRHEKQRVNKHKTSFTHNVTYESFKTEEIADITRYLDDAFRAPRPAQIMNLKIEKTPFVSDIHCLAGLHRSQAAARSFGLKLMASGASVCVINYGMFHRWWCDKDYCVLLGFPQEPPLQKLGQWAKGPPGHTKPSKAAESPDLRAASAAGSTDRRAVIERTEKPAHFAMPAPGRNRSRTFRDASPLEYVCSVHGKMRTEQNLEEDGEGGWKCIDGEECRTEGKGAPKGKSSSGDAAKAVWLGNLPEEATFKELMELGKQVGTPTWAEKTGKSRGYLLFKTPAEATSAIESLNGAWMSDYEIEADKWTGKAPLQKGGSKGGSKGGKKGKVQVVYEYVPVYKAQFQKKGKGQGKGKGKKRDTTKCVKIGNIPEGTTFKDLMELGKAGARDCTFADDSGLKHGAYMAQVFEGKGKGTGTLRTIIIVLPPPNLPVPARSYPILTATFTVFTAL